MKKNTRIGTYITKKTPGESFKAFIPPSLPPHPEIALEQLSPFLDEALRFLGEFNGVVSIIPNRSLFVYMYVRKEALLSSQIEGTQSSFSDLMLFEHNQTFDVEMNDVEEVSHYVAALTYGIDRLEEGFPLCMRLLREMHGILLRGGRGVHKQPGEFRTSQNWIGGTRPGNALYVPPPPENLGQLLSDFERFLHDKTVPLPLLVKVGLAHVQFESIHPFLDGNGRLGRLLITLFLYERGLMRAPLLYFSLYLKQHRSDYYRLLQEVRTDGNWEAWLEFFLQGIAETAQQALSATKKIHAIFCEDEAKVEKLGRIKVTCRTVLDYLKQMPQVSTVYLSQKLGISLPSARIALAALATCGIVCEVGHRKRNKVYMYKHYLKLLEEGTEL